MSRAAEIQKLVIASGNAGKLREIRHLLEPLGIEVVPQSAFNITEVEEPYCTFVENALAKARHASKSSGLPALADDSGICVNALNGGPGVYSARYAGSNASDSDNIAKLLGALASVEGAQRTARFQCLMVYMEHAHDPTPIICQGTWEGRILLEPRGAQGFGYDPVFFVRTHNCSAAELPPIVKNNLSHRGQALRQLLTALGTRQ